MATFESESDCFSVYVFSSSNKLEMMREVKSNLPSRQFGMHCARAHSLRQHDEAGPTLMYSFPRALGPPSFAAAADAARRPLEKRERGRDESNLALCVWRRADAAAAAAVSAAQSQLLWSSFSRCQGRVGRGESAVASVEFRRKT